MQINATHTYEVSDDLLNEIACYLITTAVEGGINYWASVEKYRWGSPDLGHSHTQADGTKDWKPGDREYATAIIHDDASGDPNNPDFPPTPVDAAKMIEAIKKVAAGDVKPFYNMGYDKTFRERLLDIFAQAERNPGMTFIEADHDSDADDADSMMQIAILGSVIYG